MYAVANGRSIGIFDTWEECKKSVIGFKFAKYKKFQSVAEARRFVYESNPTPNTLERVVDQLPPSTDTPSYEQKRENEEHKTEEITPDYYVYTDGACSNNGQSGASAGIGVYFAENDPRNTSLKVNGKQTNNTAEIQALIVAYGLIESDILTGKRIVVVSDSTYAIRGASEYGEKCEKRNWIDNIPNKRLVQTVYNLYKDKPNVTFQYVQAHTNKTDVHSVGNYNADRFARQAIISNSH